MAEDVFAGGSIAPWSVPAPLRAAVRRLEADGLVCAVVAAWVALLTAALPKLFVTDSWLALVDGRLVASHGLPHHDTLTYWTLGERWVDQQWGAQLALYGADRAGGLVLTGIVGVLLVGLALAAVAVAARRLGASSRSTAVAVLVPIFGAPWLAQVRSQTFALPLFAVTYALVAADARRPGRRVLLVLPLLVLWANLHGSVSLGAALVAAYGVVLLARRRWLGAALVAAPVALLASPYGFALVAYYRMMLVAPPLAHVVKEWRPMAVQPATVGFFATALLAVALLARHRHALTWFEQCALPLLLVAALDATRNAVWFELALAIALPRLFDAVRAPVPAERGVRRINALVGITAVVAAACVLGAHAGRADTWFGPAGGADAAAAVARAAGPHGVVLADDEHADWLLWQQPALAGRVAYDVRFELFDARQLAAIVALDRDRVDMWSHCGSTMSVFTLAGAADARLLRLQGILGRGARALTGAGGFVAYAQRPSAAPCRI